MAERYAIAPQVVDPIETHINHTIDGLIGLLNVRRVQLLELVRNTREEKRAAKIARQQMIDQLNEAQAQLQETLRENPLQSMRERIVQEMEDKMRDLRNNIPVETRLQWQCDTRDLEMSISRLGEIVQVPVGVPDYATFQTSTVATGKTGSDPGELICPSGIAIHEDTHQIFVANHLNQRVEIFSDTGEYLNQLGVGQLICPWGIAIHRENVYVSCWGDNTVSQFTLTDMSLVRKIGGRGSNNGQFNFPCQLTTDPIGHVFIADRGNSRISVHDTDLNHLRNITHQSMSEPYDVKVSRNRVYVLCPSNNPCMHVLTLEGDKIHSLITCGQGMDVLYPFSFCLDPLNNFVISDRRSHSIRVFSPEGNLLHTVGTEGHQQGMLCYPQGIAITPNGRLIIEMNSDYSPVQSDYRRAKVLSYDPNNQMVRMEYVSDTINSINQTLSELNEGKFGLEDLDCVTQSSDTLNLSQLIDPRILE
ncbi:E3 ubiquitin-protein ligase TRIM71-like [Oopsacas minuta]|uniref:E3 ubiquitin-protein ligase TRIM71-like n=1 Tax=Oopsacas minuta TaxID=111878 RepID=A0AAV7JZQ4_9METZ|nr:E3 ubiquitin-protein ligase TRIM71-like [Oopsacas minuta]